MSNTPCPDSTAVTPDTGDIQKLVTRGYTFNCSRHLILTVQDQAHARKFLKGLADNGWLIGAQENRGKVDQQVKKNGCTLSLGITFAGLQKLGLDERRLDMLRAHAPAFSQGAWARAKDQLGDVGDSAPVKWEDCFRPESAHLLLTLHANLVPDLKKAVQRLAQLAGNQAFAGPWTCHDGEHLGSEPIRRRVHFGLLDGLSNPTIVSDPHQKIDPVHNMHRLGEFVLGHKNNECCDPWRLPAERPESSRVPAAEQSRALADFFKNGSFAAFRKIEQDEPKFRDFVRKKAETLRGKYTLTQAEAFIRAKLLGRWDDGRVVQSDDTMGSGPTGPAVAASANFDFTNDQAGRGCPFGSHIRRMNPRDDPVVPFRRRPILRRGMPYGPRYDPEGGADNGKPRGLLGLFFCASLEHQFEHLVGQWVNDTPMGPNNRGNARDPLIGHNNSNLHVYDIPLSDTTALALRGLEPFVTTKGTLYAFFPSLSAIEQLADQRPPDGTNRLYPCETGLKSP